MIAVQDPEVAAQLRFLRQHAMDVSDLARHSASDVVLEHYPERGWNYRMTDMQAALGLCQLEALDEILARRTRLAARYTAALDAIPALHAPYDPPHCERTWQSYSVRVDPQSPIGRTELMRRLLRRRRRDPSRRHGDPPRGRVRGGGSLRPPAHGSRGSGRPDAPAVPGLSDDEQDLVIEPADHPHQRHGGGGLRT